MDSANPAPFVSKAPEPSDMLHGFFPWSGSQIEQWQVLLLPSLRGGMLSQVWEFEKQSGSLGSAQLACCSPDAVLALSSFLGLPRLELWEELELAMCSGCD